MRYDPLAMTNKQREAFLAWVEGEGLDPNWIANDGRFSVHNGWISGNEFVPSTENQDSKIPWKDRAVTRHFRVPQKNPVPDLKELFD